MKLKQGTQVICNGYPGAIVRQYSCRMYEVRLESGLVCVDIGDLRVIEPLHRGTDEWFEARNAADDERDHG